MSEISGSENEENSGGSNTRGKNPMSTNEHDAPESGQPNLNQAILEGLAKLQESIDRRDQSQYDDYGGPREPSEDSASYVNIADELHDLMDIGGPSVANDEEHDVLLEYNSQLDVETDTKGPKVNEKVAAVVNKLCLKRISQDQSKSLLKKHLTPENIKMKLPKCEQSIWNQIPGPVRVADVKLQSTQTLLLSAINCQLKVSEALLKLKADKETMTSCLDGLTLSMTANYELNQRRRDSMKPQFKPEFAKGLCTSTAPADEFLFGGDTAKRVKEISEINKSKVCKSQFPSRGRERRFSPYPRQSRGDSRGRGRGYYARGGQRSYGNYSGSRGQYFYNAPQSDQKSHPKSTKWYVQDDIKTLITSQSPFAAGKTKYYISQWRRITTDPEILDYVSHCHIEFIDEPCKYSRFGQQHFNVQQHACITMEVQKLVDLRVIEVSGHEVGECLSPIFVTPKPDGSFRLIFNLKKCNKAVCFRHFKMDTLATVIGLVTPNCYMASLDLKHAYYSIPIAEEQRKFLKFMWNGTLYEFRALPMGLTSSPRIFTKVMKPPLAFLRKMGFIVSGYIDDFFLQGNNAEECKNNVKETVKLFLDLGFTIHPEKSVTTPSQELTFLGFILNSQNMTVTMSQDKKGKLRDLCIEALKGGPLTIRFVARVIGKIISSLPGVQYGKLHYRSLERDKIKALASYNGNFEACMHISPLANDELNWWVGNIVHAYKPVTHVTCSYVFQTDASGAGWGIVCTSVSNMRSSGTWSEEQLEWHINVRELYVVFICLTTFFKGMSKCHIKFELDNMTAVSYINHMGGSKSLSCDVLARKIWYWCIPRGIWLSAVHIPGSENTIADSLSRRHSDHEWMLNTHYFQLLMEIFPHFTIDLFASTLNNQMPRYASWKPDPNASLIDALSQSWENEYFYAFPPFSLIPKCLEKIVADEANGVLVVPVWPTQPWYTRVLQMLTRQPRVMSWTATRELLIHPSGKMHNMRHKLKLMACPLSGDNIRSRAFLNTLPKFSSTHGGHLLANNTRFTSRDGLYSVVSGKLLHIIPL